jgi:UDP-N-acetylmuramyl-tripeptide synthetase
MDSYWACKRKLFNDCLPASHGKTGLRAVVNIDDARGAELAATLAMPHLTTSQRQTAAIQAVSATFDLNGIAARVQTPEDMCEVHSALVGRHNLENILNAMGVGIALGLPTAVLQEGVRALTAVPGRLERVADPGGCFVYVDYSHTPDALQNTLQALRELTTQHIICVFGCGGDRDRSKRPLMGKIAANLSDLAVVTSDNPRTEPPQQIIAQILEGVRAFRGREYSPETLTDGIGQKGFVVEPDRRNAIMLAVAVAQPGDTILIAGKGHETYQIIGRQKFAFDDRKVAAEESEKKWQVRR